MFCADIVFLFFNLRSGNALSCCLSCKFLFAFSHFFFYFALNKFPNEHCVDEINVLLLCRQLSFQMNVCQ